MGPWKSIRFQANDVSMTRLKPKVWDLFQFQQQPEADDGIIWAVGFLQETTAARKARLPEAYDP